MGAFPGGLSKISLSWGREASLARMRVVKTMIEQFDPYSSLSSQELNRKNLISWIARNVKPCGKPLGKSSKQKMLKWLEEESHEEVDQLAGLFGSMLSTMPEDSPPKPRQLMDVTMQRNEKFSKTVIEERRRQLQEAIDALKVSCVSRVICETGDNTVSEIKRQLEAINKLGCISNLGGIGPIAPCGHHVKFYEPKVYGVKTAMAVFRAKQEVERSQEAAKFYENYGLPTPYQEWGYDPRLITPWWNGPGKRPEEGHCYDCTEPGCTGQISRMQFLVLHYQWKKAVYDEYQQKLVTAMNHVDQAWPGVQKALAAIGARYLATHGAK